MLYVVIDGQSTSILSVEPEYSLPQNSIQGIDATSVDRLRRGPPEPYASSAIYTELTFKVCKDKSVRILLIDEVFSMGYLKTPMAYFDKGLYSSGLLNVV